MFKTYFDRDKLNSEKNANFLSFDAFCMPAFLSNALVLFLGENRFSTYHMVVIFLAIFFSYNFYKDTKEYFVRGLN